SWQSDAHALPPEAAPRVASATTQPARPVAVPVPTRVSAPLDEASIAQLGPEEHARRVQEALKGLRSSDPGAIQAALMSLSELRGRAAADAIALRLQAGLPPHLTELALDVVRGLEQPVAAPVLTELTLHRRWQVRAKAVAALGGLRVRTGVSVLLYSLDDPSPEVRSAAARALGQLGDPRAMPALTSAVARGIDGALEGFAQLANARQLEAILERGKSDLKATEAALWVVLTRANVPPVTKVKVIELVRGHAAQDQAQQVLAAWREKLKAAGDLRLLATLNREVDVPAKAKSKSAGALSAVAGAGAKP
ncbi:MAG TPA: HEAT repeat domain-containing protein, partial [Polyangiales bacterium]